MNLSASGSRMEPRSLFLPERRAIVPSSLSVTAAARKRKKAQSNLPYETAVAKTGMRTILVKVRILGRFSGRLRLRAVFPFSFRAD